MYKNTTIRTSLVISYSKSPLAMEYPNYQAVTGPFIYQFSISAYSCRTRGQLSGERHQTSRQPMVRWMVLGLDWSTGYTLATVIPTGIGSKFPHFNHRTENSIKQVLTIDCEIIMTNVLKIRQFSCISVKLISLPL